MYVVQIRDDAKFIDAAQNSGQPVRVSERAVAVPVREQGGVVVRPALERQYTLEVKDNLQGDTRLIFTEHLIEQDGKLPFDASLYEKLKGANLRILETGRISRAA
jgi:hypothetical protein